MSLVTIEVFYAIVGLILLLVAGRIALDASHPKRWGSALFWALLAVTFLFGRMIPPVIVGYLVLAMVALAAVKQVGPSTGRSAPRAERVAHEERLRHRLLWPALLIPATAVAGTLLLGRVRFGSIRLVDPRQVALISLSLGALLALGLGLRLTRAPVLTPLAEGSRLLQTIGWALILPQIEQESLAATIDFTKPSYAAANATAAAMVIGSLLKSALGRHDAAHRALA